MITKEEIKEDIKSFEDRITQARDKLNALPQTAGTWQGRAKLKAQRKVLNDDIKHINRLILIARGGLLDFLKKNPLYTEAGVLGAWGCLDIFEISTQIFQTFFWL